MPETNHALPSRRQFLATGSKLGVACGLACLCPIARVFSQDNSTGAIPEPKKLNYCGYTCPPDCPMKLAGESDDVEAKRKAFELWDLEGRYGLTFDPDDIFCHGCKTEEKELGMAVSHCPVRPCVIERKLDCCIECDELATCDKELWKKFPTFYESVLEMRTRLLDA